MQSLSVLFGQRVGSLAWPWSWSLAHAALVPGPCGPALAHTARPWPKTKKKGVIIVDFQFMFIIFLKHRYCFETYFIFYFGP